MQSGVAAREAAADTASRPKPVAWREVVTCVDGFGTPGEKIDDYRIFDNQQLIQYPGFKLFYKLDKPLMSPGDVLGLNPAPLMVMYQ